MLRNWIFLGILLLTHSLAFAGDLHWVDTVPTPVENAAINVPALPLLCEITMTRKGDDMGVMENRGVHAYMQLDQEWTAFLGESALVILSLYGGEFKVFDFTRSKAAGRDQIFVTNRKEDILGLETLKDPLLAAFVLDGEKMVAVTLKDGNQNVVEFHNGIAVSGE